MPKYLSGHDKENKNKAEMAEKIVKAWKLFKDGKSYREIGTELGISRQTAHNHVHAELKKLAEERRKIASEYVDVELERLDYLLNILIKDVETSVLANFNYSTKKIELDTMDRADVQIIDRIIKIQERRAKLLGLDQPIKKEIKTEMTLAEMIAGTYEDDDESKDQNES